MGHLFRKLIFLWVGNISMWIYYAGRKKMEDVAKEDNEILGLIIALILGFIIFFSFQ
jgi:hypothetical protein